MVLERFYSANFLQEKPHFGFLLGVSYSVIGIFLGMFLFPNDPALIAVAIASILFIPSLQKLTYTEEHKTRKKHGTQLKHILTDYKQLIKIYIYAFFGVFFTFTFFSLILPSLAANHLFQQQLNVFYGSAFSTGLFYDILINNIKVLLLVFILSIIAGNGAILLIVWNASVWGTIFGTIVKTGSVAAGISAASAFFIVLFTVLPHMFLEILSYVLSVVSGTVISEGFVREKLSSPKMQRILQVNLTLIGVAILILVLAGVIEAFVLENATTYTNLADLAFGA
jgi:uncharacterized membrane protein SpoIIM required for sporulation